MAAARPITRLAAAAAICAMAGSAFAQPTITSLGAGIPLGVSNNTGGSYYIGGSGMITTAADRWTLTGSTLTAVEISGSNGQGYISADGAYIATGIVNGPTRFAIGNTATGVSPAFTPLPTLTPSSTAPAATEFGGARWNASSNTLSNMGAVPIIPFTANPAPTIDIGTSGVYGSSSSGGSTSSFLTPNAISANGRFLVGLAYVCAYNNNGTPGTSISASTFYWRPVIWDAQGNSGAGSLSVLPTPFRTATSVGANTRRRTGNPYAVSNDGTVVMGAQEHNVGASPSADPDGGRPVVWRWNGSSYDMTYLPNGVNASGFPITVSSTPGAYAMNSTGTIIVGRAVDSNSFTYMAKWVWNSGTNSWNAPINLGNALTTPASWQPSCVTAVSVGGTLAMTEDGNTVVGSVTYQGCGLPIAGGFIWTSTDGTITDWYDYLKGLNTPGVVTGGAYGPIGDSGNPDKGLPALGYPTGISPDGTAIVGFQGGNTRIPGAQPWIVQMSGGSSCVAPAIALNPSNELFARCSVGNTLSTVILNAFAGGTAPFTYQWYKGSTALSDGNTGNGSNITGSTTYQMRINNPVPADNGQYHCVITGCSGQTATTNDATVQNDPTVPTVGDTCGTAIAVSGEGSTPFNICGCYLNDGFSACSTGTEYADVWFRYTPSFTGNARFQTCGTGWDTTLELLDNCGGSILACNNDVGNRGLVGTSCSSTRSLISSYPVTSGTPILVRVGSLSSFMSNTGSLTISQAPAAPVNDLCTNATPVTLGTYNYNLAEATDDFVFGANFCHASETSSTASNRDVWFRLISPFGGTYSISTCTSQSGAITNPILHVMTDCSATNVLACSDNIGSTPPPTAPCTSNSAQVLNLQIGGSVLIRVAASGQFAPNSGTGQITITGTPNAGCGSADFNCDGDIGTDLDIEAFFSCLAGNCPAFPCMNNADFNGDGDIGTDADIEAFFRVLAGGNC
jgi:hypothetical protein